MGKALNKRGKYSHCSRAHKKGENTFTRKKKK